jgi:DNA methylase
LVIETNVIPVVAGGKDSNLHEEKPLLTTAVGTIQIEFADVLTRYEKWLSPTVIVSDGPYGLGLFPGDPPTPNKLAEWYEPHIAAWSSSALPETTLWFWCNEIGWATVHPILEKYGWRYRALHVWDKGIAHVAGNVNSKTIRRFPVVTEVCVQYIREVCLLTGDGKLLPIQEWLRYEWQRSGIPLNRTNEACGVKNAATRKYFTQDHLWYFPPPDMMEKIVNYSNTHGNADGRPYFLLEGEAPTIAEKWERMRAKWKHTHGVTNVWAEPANRGEERVKNRNSKYVHANQKPLKLIKRIVEASSDPVDVLWEPFGGLCPTAVVALRTNRVCYSAEINFEYYQLAQKRLLQESILMSQIPSPTLWDEEGI